ncbi:unnamed protein product [Hermetia illucens]|uniref:Uncharacterized protein n=2 Tax=Hermetia illucens TaxID=343691 RepID=A0A7R8UD43_HERIL|nr:unnamed protein product [Hermetia illucens]
MIGEFASVIGLLITSIFMDVIPMEFGAIIERVVPSMLGGQTLMIMGIYSYLTEITEEKDRAFRFGIFAVCANIIQLVGTPFSGTLFLQLGYVKMYIIGACILLLGILYLIFFIPEIKKKPKAEETNGNINTTFESGGKTIATLEIDDKKIVLKPKEEAERQKNCLVDFFDPTSAYECIQIFAKKRAHNLRTYLILLVILQLLFIAPAIGEADYYYNFQLLQLKWNGEMFSYYNTYSAALNIVGTFLMTAVLIKFLSLSDSMAGFIASLGTVISKPLLAFSKEAILYYVGTTVDLFISCKAIAVKSIISNFVETEELGRLYSVLGITEALSGFIFPPLYSQIYSSTIESFPGAFYLFSEIFLVPTLFIFIAVYIYLRKQKKRNPTDTPENGIDNPAMEVESTRV